MGRDLDELTSGALSGAFGTTFLMLFFSLPVAALILVVARRWIAIFPLVGWLALVVAWFLHYATDWLPPVTEGGGAAGLVLLLLLAGWVVLVVGAFVPSRPAAD